MSSSKNTIVINGKVYDALTGLPVAAPDVPKKPQEHTVHKPTPVHKPVAASSHHSSHAKSVHHKAQKSTTLRRDILKKPANPTSAVGAARRKPGTTKVTKSAHIHKFAPHPQPIQSLDVATPHQAHAVKVTHAPVAAHKPAVDHAPAKLSSREVKEHLISRAAHAPKHDHKTHETKKRGSFRQSRRFALVTASFAVMVFAGYMTYLNMPSLSVRVAASQADLAASFPDYHPDGYRFSGPVAYAPGQVAIKFQSTGSDLAYTVTQQKSAWNSEAVYDNLVAGISGEEYTSHSQQGLTIYTFDNKAAWVNRGILYTVDGDAPLSDDQLLRIAGSM